MAARTKSKQGKNPGTEKVMESSDANMVNNYEPSVEEIRELAEILYHQRIERNEYGTADKDWLQAESFLKNQGKDELV